MEKIISKGLQLSENENENKKGGQKKNNQIQRQNNTLASRIPTVKL